MLSHTPLSVKLSFDLFTEFDTRKKSKDTVKRADELWWPKFSVMDVQYGQWRHVLCGFPNGNYSWRGPWCVAEHSWVDWGVEGSQGLCSPLGNPRWGGAVRKPSAVLRGNNGDMYSQVRVGKVSNYLLSLLKLKEMFMWLDRAPTDLSCMQQLPWPGHSVGFLNSLQRCSLKETTQ